MPDGTTSDAYLLRKEFIIVREAERNYEIFTAAFPHQGRELPFNRVRILTEVTPLLTPGTIPPVVGKSFVPMIGLVGASQQFNFQLQGIDKDNTVISFQTPLLFVPEDAVGRNLTFRISIISSRALPEAPSFTGRKSPLRRSHRPIRPPTRCWSPTT